MKLIFTENSLDHIYLCLFRLFQVSLLHTVHHSSKPPSLKSIGKLVKLKQEDNLLSREVIHFYLFHLQPMTPDPFQEVTKAGNQGVLFHPCDVDFPVPQLHSLSAHLLHQHPLGLQGTSWQDQTTTVRRITCKQRVLWPPAQHIYWARKVKMNKTQRHRVYLFSTIQVRLLWNAFFKSLVKKIRTQQSLYDPGQVVSAFWIQFLCL